MLGMGNIDNDYDGTACLKAQYNCFLVIVYVTGCVMFNTFKHHFRQCTLASMMMH